jgi:hypothetical protein
LPSPDRSLASVDHSSVPDGCQPVAAALARPFLRRGALRLLGSVIALVAMPVNHPRSAAATRPSHDTRKNNDERGDADNKLPVEPREASAPVALGAYIANSPGDAGEIDRFSQEIGRSPAIVMWYEQWGGWDDGKLRLNELREVASRDAMPMITWDPWDPYAGPDQPKYRLARIARGDFDAYIDSWAVELASYGEPLYLRFGHEMNGDWYPWCAGCNGNTAADYVAAWVRIHDRFLAAGAANVRWVWSPNIEFSERAPLAELYPGDAYVDWVAMDGYNWGTSRDGKAWESFEDVFLPTYRRLLALTAKPMMIAETASTEQGGDKAAWIRQAFLEQLPVTLPKVRAVVWFHENKETDWRVSSSPAAVAAFKDIADTPFFQGRLT